MHYTWTEEVVASCGETVESRGCLVTTYDRSDLIKVSVKTLTDNLLQVMLIVCTMIVLFLLHARSALVIAIMPPVVVALSFIPMCFR